MDGSRGDENERIVSGAGEALPGIRQGAAQGRQRAPTARCEGCIVFHTRACLRLGVSRPELLDMPGVAVEMGGGPSTIYGARALACYDEMAQAG